MKPCTFIALSLPALCLACAPTVTRMPAATVSAESWRDAGAGTVPLAEGWNAFGSPELSALIARARDASTGVAVLLGDLPSLSSHDLAEVLTLAGAHDRAMVADIDGTGTTVLAATPGVPIDPRFGPGSAAAHELAGHVRLPVPATSTARQDVDVPADLAAVQLLGVGAATGALLGPLHPVVDGERFTVTRRGGGYDLRWDTGPNDGYGFSVQRSDRDFLSDAELEQHVRDFLAAVDPRTGVID